ncbi:ABC transporter ATP-binding protein [bacterium]|nr:ABC transporter ATP-binding protein [bacterium]
MDRPIVEIDRLGKKFRKGSAPTLREQIAGRLSLSLRKARRSDTDFWALKDVCFNVGEGEVVGIIGRNGAGKSTLLKILTRITPPTQGHISMRGRVSSLLEVGTGFHPELTGRENIFLNGAVLGMTRPEIKSKFDEIVSFAEISGFLDTPVKRYSSGMYIRLAFAVAAHLEPEILIVDEVLAVGDAQFQKKCLGKMGEVARSGRTVLFVSHNMAAVSQLCMHGVWLEQGCVKQIGFSSDVVKAYLSDGGGNVASRCWEYPENSPGDDRVRLTAASVIQHGQIASVIDINAPFEVEIEFRVLRAVDNLVAAVNLFNGEGLCLFCSADWQQNHLEPGTYRKHVELPARLFADGSVRVLLQLVFYDPDIPSVVVPDALSFMAADSSHPDSVRGPFHGNWPGVVRVGLTWSSAMPIDADDSCEPSRRTEYAPLPEQ